LAQAGISIESFLQDPAGDAAAVPIVLTTQICPRSALEKAVQEIGSLDISAAPPRIFPIEDGAARKRAWSAA
jgi:homoserine dehydrogenase